MGIPGGLDERGCEDKSMTGRLPCRSSGSSGKEPRWIRPLPLQGWVLRGLGSAVSRHQPVAASGATGPKAGQ